MLSPVSFLVQTLSLLLFLSLLLHVNATSSIFQPAFSHINSTSIIDLYCFDQDSHPGIGATNSADCRGALRIIASLPEYRSRAVYRFSKNPRNGIKVPKGFQYGLCVIYVSCSNDHDSDYFSLVDVSRAAISIIKNCVDQPEIKYGGLEGVGNSGTFYVSVGKPVGPRKSLTSSTALPEATSEANDSLDVLVESALTELSNGDTNASSES